MEKTNKNNIFVFQPTEEELNMSINESCKYAIYSLPFTTNRMNKSSIKERIKNIIKGKLAENLLFCFFKRYKIPFISTSTPYYQVDKKDFILLDYEWDIKNNYFLCEEAVNNLQLMEEFYGLIPNRHDKDQWSKAFNSVLNHTPAVLFTFMYKVNLEINIPKELENFLETYNRIYNGKPMDNVPIEYEDKLKYLMDKHVLLCSIESKYGIKLYITGFVIEEEKDDFFDLGPGEVLSGKQYCFRLIIKNKAILIRKTNSFISLLKTNGLFK